MDGTLLDSEPIWDIAVEQFTLRHRILLTPALRESTLGNSLPDAITKVHDAAEAPRGIGTWPGQPLGDRPCRRTLRTGLPWRPGAADALDMLLDVGVPSVLVTNTIRELTDVALDTLGRHRFAATICADEVVAGKPQPYVPTCSRVGRTTSRRMPGRRGLADRNDRRHVRGLPDAGRAVGGAGPEGIAAQLWQPWPDSRSAIWSARGRASTNISIRTGHRRRARIAHREDIRGAVRRTPVTRPSAAPRGSGTVAALDPGIHTLGKKIIEEAGEVWLAAEHESDDSLGEEISQLLYWLQVMIKRGLTSTTSTDICEPIGPNTFHSPTSSKDLPTMLRGSAQQGRPQRIRLGRPRRSRLPETFRQQRPHRPR